MACFLQSVFLPKIKKRLLKYLKSLFLILLLLRICNTEAQVPMQKATLDSVFVFRFDPSNPDDLNSFFVKELVRFNYLNLYKTNYALNYSFEVSIVVNPAGDCLIIPEFKKLQLVGDVFYLNFDLSDVLMPSAFDFNLKFKGDTSTYIFHKSISDTGKPEPFIADNISADTYKTTEIEISKLSFHYDEGDKQVFFDRINAIHSFAGFYELLEFNLQKSTKINPETKDSLLSVFFEISDLIRFNTILEKNEITFDLPEFYSAHFYENQRKLNSNLRRLQTLFGQNADTLPRGMTTQEMDAAAKTIIAMQKKYMSRMKSSNHLFEPVYLLVANFYSTPDDWAMQEKSLRKLLPSQSSAEFEDQEIKSLCKTLYTNFINEADSLIAKEKYIEAALMIENATTFCKLYPDNQCEILTFNKQAQAKYGIYDSYLQVAFSAMEMGKLDFAQKYIFMARDFQMANSNTIISAAKIDQYLEKLAWSFFESARDFYDLNDYQQAYKDYVNAREIYDLIEINTYDELIDKQIKRCFINN